MILSQGRPRQRAPTAEALRCGADWKTLTDMLATHTREREASEDQRNKERQAWYKKRREERDAWEKERLPLIYDRDALQKDLRHMAQTTVKAKEPVPEQRQDNEADQVAYCHEVAMALRHGVGELANHLQFLSGIPKMALGVAKLGTKQVDNLMDSEYVTGFGGERSGGQPQHR